MKITNRYTDAVMYEDDAPTIKETVESAVKSDANLRGANLRGADLRGAYLSGAYLSDADQKITLIGKRPLFSIGSIGSRSDYLYAYLTDHGVYVRTGCFLGTLEKFAAAVDEKHKDSIHGAEYRAAIEMIKIHAELWTPEDEVRDEQ